MLRPDGTPETPVLTARERNNAVLSHPSIANSSYRSHRPVHAGHDYAVTTIRVTRRVSTRRWGDEGFYNTSRKHSFLGQISPDQFEERDSAT